MGDYEDVLASLETLNHSVLKAMGYTKKVSGYRWHMGVRGLSAGLVPDVLRGVLHQGCLDL